MSFEFVKFKKNCWKNTVLSSHVSKFSIMYCTVHSQYCVLYHYMLLFCTALYCSVLCLYEYSQYSYVQYFRSVLEISDKPSFTLAKLICLYCTVHNCTVNQHLYACTLEYSTTELYRYRYHAEYMCNILKIYNITTVNHFYFFRLHANTVDLNVQYYITFNCSTYLVQGLHYMCFIYKF